MKVIFNKPYYFEKELNAVRECLADTGIASDGKYSKLCEKWFREEYLKQTLLTASCTSALEMSALLAELMPGYEVIMPSFTFVSTANAFVLRGAVPVFVLLLFASAFFGIRIIIDLIFRLSLHFDLIMISIYFSVLLIISYLTVISIYIGGIFSEVKQKPLYVVKKTMNL